MSNDNSEVASLLIRCAAAVEQLRTDLLTADNLRIEAMPLAAEMHFHLALNSLEQAQRHFRLSSAMLNWPLT